MEKHEQGRVDQRIHKMEFAKFINKESAAKIALTSHVNRTLLIINYFTHSVDSLCVVDSESLSLSSTKDYKLHFYLEHIIYKLPLVYLPNKWDIFCEIFIAFAKNSWGNR